MKKKIFKALLGTVYAAKILVITLSSFALSLNSAKAMSTPNEGNNSSPLLTNTQQSQDSVAKVVAAIKLAANGTVSGSNAQAAIGQVIAGSPGVSMETLVAAINALGLSGDALSEAISAVSIGFDTSAEAVTSAIITNSYMSGGKSAADDRIVELRAAVGDSIVDTAVETSESALNNMSPEQLNQIATAGGGPYNG